MSGRELEPDDGDVGTDEGTRLLLELATGIIAEVLGEPNYENRRPERRERRGAGSTSRPDNFPPPGSCRFWFPDRPPGQQPPPGDATASGRPFLVEEQQAEEIVDAQEAEFVCWHSIIIKEGKPRIVGGGYDMQGWRPVPVKPAVSLQTVGIK